MNFFTHIQDEVCGCINTYERRVINNEPYPSLITTTTRKQGNLEDSLIENGINEGKYVLSDLNCKGKISLAEESAPLLYLWVVGDY